jgi:hypothetical protein
MSSPLGNPKRRVHQQAGLCQAAEKAMLIG